MAILPVAGGALVGEGPNILFLADDDGDGQADREEVLLTGFGIQDSHLLPHRFVRAPGGWVYLAQGAFNYSRVVTRSGEEVPFDQCKVGRFRPDGSTFEVVGMGLNNLWGFVLDRRGDKWIQEANDHGYPVVPFEHGMSYPGIGDHRFHDDSPWRPSLAEFRMGGTGLSGLARSDDRDGFPAPWNETFFVANPITNRLQSIRAHRDPKNASEISLEQAPDLLVSKDPNFRPVAIHFGPDGCLYVVDWYNPIISHNEVPRDHPSRDKTSSRIWRIRHDSQERRAPVEVAAARNSELVRLLRSDSTLTARAAWHQIAERGALELVDDLRSLARDSTAPVEDRLLAVWSLEDLGYVDLGLVDALLDDGELSLRREGARHLGDLALDVEAMIYLAGRIAEQPDSTVRVAAIESLRADADFTAEHAAALFMLLRDPLSGPTLRLSQNGAEVKTGLAGDIEFERSLIRAALEEHRQIVSILVDSLAQARTDSPDFSPEQRAFLLLCTGGAEGAQRLADLIPLLGREPSTEELALLARHVEDPEVRGALGALLVRADPTRIVTLLLETADRWESSSLEAEIAQRLRALVAADPTPEHSELLVRCATQLRLAALEGDVLAILERGQIDRLRCLRALVELGAQDAALFANLATSSLPGSPGRRLAVAALAGVPSAEAFERVLELWPVLERPARRDAVAALLAREEGAQRLLAAIEGQDIELEALDVAALSRLELQLGDDPRLSLLRQRIAGASVPVLRLDGSTEDFVDTDLELRGPFTVETWIKLEPGISNADGLLAAPPNFDLNFHDGRARLYLGAGRGDVIIATRRIEPERWTHVALTRDEQDSLSLYVNGELDLVAIGAGAGDFSGLDVGRTGPAAGTQGWISEFRVWTTSRSAAEIGADFRRELPRDARPEGLLLLLPGDPAALSGAARVESALDRPPIQSAEEAREELASFARQRELAQAGGDPTRGRELFLTTCAACHRVAGEGGRIGPNLDGAGNKGVEGLLRAILTPSAGVESGYRALIVRTRGGEILDGFLASESAASIVLRRRDREDLVLDREDIEEARFDALSVMPEGLLDTLTGEEIAHLFAYLLTLR